MNIQINGDNAGVALLVSNDYKNLGKDYELPFTHKGADDVEQVFKEFTYVVCRKKNVSTADFVSCYKYLAEFKYDPSMTRCKRIFFYFCGHGNDGVLRMQDGKEVQIKDMINCFKKHIAKDRTLADMAKIFFFDAYREIPAGGSKSVKRARMDDEITFIKSLEVPREGKVLVAYSSTRYYVSHGSPTTGSKWTNCLVKALRTSEESHDVVNVLTAVNRMMRSESDRHCFQAAEFISRLEDPVRFNREAIKT